ncbi:MAG TPA: MarR family transcriptional regulator [Chthonomonas sp.]|uniref:MarR family winged helix-turn-helix transcriptional regulator n=1 Tax=Chthonomonas sp. TaxID=2282153 RepID=UPI002B4B6C32|nr:MarR family transcriptional regulator [Chthonomonas sp.]HLI48977.1 MarR family transcriptional regulator [Chthonomonas sp.]
MDSDIERALKLFVVLARCHNSIMSLTHHHLRQRGLSISEFGVLEVLYHKGPLSLGEIAQKVLLKSGSFTYVVNRLVTKGLVCCSPCPQDKRKRYAQLTPKGRELIEHLFPLHAQIVYQAMNPLSADEQEEATRLLKRLGLAAAEQVRNLP